MNKRNLELHQLENMILSICTYMYRPIRKTMLIKLVTDLFETNTKKQVEFALAALLDEHRIYEYKNYIHIFKYPTHWDGTTTAADNAVPKYLLTLKEEAKEYCYFFFGAEEPLNVNDFFYFIDRFYVGLLGSGLPSDKNMLHIIDNADWYVKDNIFRELNDSYMGPLTQFFNKKDCRILIKNVCQLYKGVKINLLLVPGKKGGYTQAHEQYKEFQHFIHLYLNGPIIIKTQLMQPPKKGGFKFR